MTAIKRNMLDVCSISISVPVHNHFNICYFKISRKMSRAGVFFAKPIIFFAALMSLITPLKAGTLLYPSCKNVKLILEMYLGTHLN